MFRTVHQGTLLGVSNLYGLLPTAWGANQRADSPCDFCQSLFRITQVFSRRAMIIAVKEGRDWLRWLTEYLVSSQRVRPRTLQALYYLPRALIPREETHSLRIVWDVSLRSSPQLSYFNVSPTLSLSTVRSSGVSSVLGWWDGGGRVNRLLLWSPERGDTRAFTGTGRWQRGSRYCIVHEVVR